MEKINPAWSILQLYLGFHCSPKQFPERQLPHQLFHVSPSQQENLRSFFKTNIYIECLFEGGRKRKLLNNCPFLSLYDQIGSNICKMLILERYTCPPPSPNDRWLWMWSQGANCLFIPSISAAEKADLNSLSSGVLQPRSLAEPLAWALPTPVQFYEVHSLSKSPVISNPPLAETQKPHFC